MIMKILGYTAGILVGLAYIIFVIWRMFIIGAFIAFGMITFSNK